MICADDLSNCDAETFLKNGKRSRVVHFSAASSSADLDFIPRFAASARIFVGAGSEKH